LFEPRKTLLCCKTKSAKAFRALADFVGSIVGAKNGIRTRGLLSHSLQAENHNSNNDKTCDDSKTPSALKSTLPPSDCHNDTAPELPPNVVRIAVAWPSLPEAIRAGIMAMVQASAGWGKA
jgi:hypothetical protein